MIKSCRKIMNLSKIQTITNSCQAPEIDRQNLKTEKRKECKNKRWFGWLVVAIALYFVFLPDSWISAQLQKKPKATEFGYYYKGELISLTPSKRFIALSEAGTAFTPFANTKKLVRDPLSNRENLMQRKLGIYRLPSPPDKSAKPLNFSMQMKQFTETTGEEIQPVFEQGEMLLIPSNEIIVGLKNTASLSKARSLFYRFEKTHGIIEVKAYRKNTFILKINKPSNARAYKVCQFLAKQEEVDYAEPNHIIVRAETPVLPAPPGGTPPPKSQGGQSGSSATGNSPVTWTVLINESFEGLSIPSGWSAGRWDNTYADAFWSVTNYRGHAGSRSIYATGGGTQGVAPPGPYPNNSFSWLDTPTLNFASYEEVYIEFWFYAKYEDTNPLTCNVPDFAFFGVFNPSSGTTSWLNALAVCHTGNMTADITTDSGWRRALIRINPSLRLNGVKARFGFFSDGNNQEEGIYIDQVRIVGSADVDTEPLGNDLYSARHYEMKNAGQIAGLGNDNNDMNVPEAWNVVSVSPNVVVAVIDWGVDLLHSDLRLDPGFEPDGTPGGSYRPSDGLAGYHGTACAGNVGAIGNNTIGVMGTAPGVRIMPVYIGGDEAENASAIDTAVANGAHVLSNSWGRLLPSATIENAIIDALNAGTVVLFAAGNGPNNFPYTYTVAFPGYLTGSTDLICVGASSPTDEHKAAASSDGSFTWGSSFIGNGPDVVAPSPWSYTTDIRGAGGYNDGSLIDPGIGSSADYTPIFGGTSSSTPKVAGVVALMLSVNPNLTPNEVKHILRETADDIDFPGGDPKTGAGRVNAYRAVVPTVKISAPRIVNRNEEFTIKVTATAPHGLKEVGWFGQGTGIPSIDQEHWKNVTGPIVTERFENVKISDKGTYTLAANARDALYPNPGSTYPHQASDGSGIATTQIKVIPLIGALGLCVFWSTFLVSGLVLLRKRNQRQ